MAALRFLAVLVLLGTLMNIAYVEGNYSHAWMKLYLKSMGPFL